MGAFPGAPRSEGQSGQGSGETGEGGLFRRLAESLGSEEKRPGQRLHGAEGRARGETRGGPRPGPGGSEGGGGGSSGGWASLRAGCTLLRPHEFLNCPFLSGLPDGCSGLRPPRPSSEARVRVWSSCRLLVLVNLELAAPLPLPQHVVKPPVFRVSAGGRGGREPALPHYFLPQVLFHLRAGALRLSPKLALTHLGRCLSCSGGSALPWEVSP